MKVRSYPREQDTGVRGSPQDELRKREAPIPSLVVIGMKGTHGIQESAKLT